MTRVRSKGGLKLSPFPQEPVSRLAVLGVLFVAAFCLRLYRIGEPLFDFSPVRQYHSALLARGFYEWLLTGDFKTLPPDGIIEPPILELVASLAYLLTGGEHLWIPRLLSTSFWMIGGVFLYLMAKKVVSPNAALFSVAYFLLYPAIVLPSRAFMPDPLMIMLLLVSVFTILRYHEHPTSGRFLIAAAASSLALLVKPGICFFQIFAVFVALMVYRKGPLRTLTSARLLLFSVLSLLPMVLYYLYGTVIGGFLQGQVQGKVVPGYLLESYFWRGWLEQIGSMVGLVAFLGAVIGLLLVRSGFPRAMLVGLWSGYILFGLVFTFHIHTHGYYSLQFVPVVALSLGPAWDVATSYVGRRDRRSYRRAIVCALIVLAVVFSLAEQRTTILGIAQQAGGAKPFPGRYLGSALIADYEGRAKTYGEIGEAVDHSPRTIFLAPDFGYPLLYHGRIDGEYWPSSGMVAWWRSVGRAETNLGGATNRRELFDNLYSESSPEYFIVIKSEGWKDDRPLRRLLTRHFPVVVRDHGYLVFDLRSGDYRPRTE